MKNSTKMDNLSYLVAPYIGKWIDYYLEPIIKYWYNELRGFPTQVEPTTKR